MPGNDDALSRQRTNAVGGHRPISHSYNEIGGILSAHLKHCVQEAASATERGEKIDEFVKALERILT